jgi:hypothetical protein
MTYAMYLFCILLFIHSHVYVSKQAYDPGYDIPYFRPNMDETGRAQVLSPPQEV